MPKNLFYAIPDTGRPTPGSDSILEFFAADLQLQVSLHNSATQRFLHVNTFFICIQVPGNRSIQLPRVG